MEDIRIIDNTGIAKDEYGHMWGSDELILTNEMIKALIDGKCIACNNGEYSTFIFKEVTK